MTITRQEHKRARMLVAEIANKPSVSDITQAAKYRDQVWQKHGISLTKSMDLYRTARDAAKTCAQSVFDVVGSAAEYKFVEPSAGTGVFLEFLPADNTIAFDILPQHPDVQRQEFLTWLPSSASKERHAVIGAPPLGLYSDVSVAFINHALRFADVVGMIVRRHIGERQIQNGRHVNTVSLDRGAVLDMTGSPIKYDMEFRVWARQAKQGSP